MIRRKRPPKKRTKPAATATSLPQRPEPPATLPSAGAELWAAVVMDYPPKHFTAANQVLLACFCRAWAQCVECDELLDRDGLVIDGKANPAAAMRVAAWRELQNFGTKLRLPISSLQRADSAKARPDEKHRLEKPWQ